MKCIAPLAIVSGALLAVNLHAAEPRHVIVMISDGASFNTWRMTSMYEGKLGRQVYEGADFLRYACTTSPLNTSRTPNGNPELQANVVYDPMKAWSSEPHAEHAFAGYAHMKAAATDSAAAGTALGSGQKSYNSSINWANSPETTGAPLTNIQQIAHSAGYATGVVSSVQFYHATPAAFGAHNIARSNYKEIAREMFTEATLDVIMGAGHAEFTNANQPRTELAFEGIDAETWPLIKQANIDATPFNGYSVIFSREEFESLAGSTTPPKKVLGIPQVASTLQQGRAAYTKEEQVNEIPMNQGVPDLATMSTGALNVLSQNPNGFFLMIEGGAVDWAAHANQTSRIIEEQMDFNRAVEAVVAFIDRPGDAIDWSNTLLIVTTDHGNALPLGPESRERFFAPIQDNGKGNMPGVIWHSGSHTKELVPVYAKGIGAQALAEYATGSDTQYQRMYQLDGRWPDRYIDNTDIFKISERVLTEK